MSTPKSHISSGRSGTPQDIGVRDGEGRAVPLRIEGLAAGGRGVARSSGKVWFVEGGMPGDRVRARPIHERPRFVTAVAEVIEEPGPSRRPPPCPLQERCGGCPWMPIPEDEQRSWKRRHVVDALVRIGKVASPPVEETRGVEPVLRYRDRMEFAVGRDRVGSRVLGLRSAGSPHEWVDVDRCLLQSGEADKVLATLRRFVLEGPGADDPAWDPVGEPVRVGIRGASRSGAILVILRSVGPPPATADALAAALAASHPSVRGVVHVEGAAGRRGGGRVRVLSGEGSFEETWGGAVVRVPAGSFTQVHIEGASLLTGLVLQEAGHPATALELFGGLGGFALALARHGTRVTVVESDALAVDAGREAARGAGLGDRVEFLRGDAERVLRARGAGSAPPEVVVADPPRAGMGKRLAGTVAGLRAPRVVLVTCDPGTFARDARVLLDAGYRLDRVVPVDLFPQTPHVETVARLTLP